MKKIILASASPRRKELLANMGAEFDIIVSDFDERGFIEGLIRREPDISAARQTELLALQKARAVIGEVDKSEEFVIIGVDTSVVTENEILGKPLDEAEAVDMIMKLSGKTHRVISGFAIISNDKEYSSYDETFVTMRNITNAEAVYYVKNEYVLDKAGAYAIQGKASLFIEGIRGCYFNVVGLPVYKLGEALKKFDINLSCGGV